MNKKITLLPLCVDLDGTLLTADTTWAAVRIYMGEHPWWSGLNILRWLIRGRAFLKQNLAKHVKLEPASFTYSPEVLNLIQKYKKAGHLVYLVTATDQLFANQMVQHMEIFDAVFASDGRCNLRAETKARFLVRQWGEKGFIYVGNSWDDLKVWDRAFKGYAAYPSQRLYKKLKKAYQNVTLITSLKK